jgi:hypothetical protein
MSLLSRSMGQAGASLVGLVSALTFHPAGLFVENLSFLAFHPLET